MLEQILLLPQFDSLIILTFKESFLFVPIYFQSHLQQVCYMRETVIVSPGHSKPP